MAKKTIPETETETEIVSVTVGPQAICEDGVHYAPGATFETTPERAEALAGLLV